MFSPRQTSYFDTHPTVFRGLIGVLSAILLVAACFKFYNFASSPTDENLFTYAPTDIAFKKDVEAVPVFSKNENARHGTIIHKGDLFLKINEDPITTPGTLVAALNKYSPQDSVLVKVIGNPGNTRRDFRTTRAALENATEELPVTAYVIDVTENGASDRAGLKVGDLIVKINGKTFGGIFEADRIMRSAQADKAVEYEILRSGKTMILPVRLARFGIKFFQFAFFLCGVLFLLTGVFLGFKKPGEKALRLLSVAFVLQGFGFAAMADRTVLAKGFFEMILFLSPVIGVLLGMAIWLHSSAYFPKKREKLLEKKWIIVVPYLVAAVTVALNFVVDGNAFFLNGVIAMLVFNTVIYFKYRKTNDKESRKINAIVHGITAVTIVGSLLINIIANIYTQSNTLGFLIPLLILGIPFGYLYVIGRYRLFDIDIRLKRNIQYTAISLLWPALLVGIAIRVLLWLIHTDFSIPNIRITGASFEILDSPLSLAERSIAEKAIVTDLSIIVALGFLWIGRRGQKFINERYYRDQYDYKKAAREISEVTASKVEIPVLARSAVEKVATLMRVKQAAILIFKSEDDLLCGESFGVPPERFKKMYKTLDRRALKQIRSFQTDSRFSVDVLPENIKNSFKELNLLHLAPLFAKDKLTGALVIGEKLSETPFHAEDFSFLTAVANQISVAIENAFLYENLAGQERLKHELEIARRIQLESLPQKTPNITGLDISGFSKPAMEVGGDYFDYLVNSPECITIVIGDVSGKGTSAALYMSKVQGMIRSLHEITASSPRELLAHANKLLHLDIDRRSYITALGVRFDSDKRTATVARAGHLPLYHFSSETACFKEIMPKGLGLALSGNKLFEKALEEVECNFKSGDIFLMLTDGITEAQNLLKEEFGAERLQAIIAENRFLKAEEIRNRVIAEVEAFAGEAEQHDDMTVIVVKVV